MSIAIFLAFLAGLSVSVFVVRVASAALARGTNKPIAIHRAGYIGAALATIPALFASVTIGGNLGGSWFEGLAGTSSIPLGIAIGIFFTFASIIILVGILAAVLARVLTATVGA